jgi:diacylglycerol kinase (ATP)
MRVLLIHNPNAGLSTHPEKSLIRTMEGAGHQVVVASPDDDLEGTECDLVAVAGGDGTVSKVVRKLIDTQLPLAIIPLGIANNVARSLGIVETPDLLTRSLRGFAQVAVDADNKRLSVGKCSGADCEKHFIESVGCGLLTRLIATGKPEKHVRQSAFSDDRDELHHRVETLCSLLETFEATHYQVSLDGQDLSGRYLLIEAMNISHVGPGLELAPGKDPGSGMLELVLVHSDEEDELKHYLSAIRHGHPANSNFTRIPGKKVELKCRASEIHIDDKSLTSDQEQTVSIQTGNHQMIIT